MKEDIIRSFAARIEMHCDSLVEEEIGSPDGWFTSFIHYTSYYNGEPLLYLFLTFYVYFAYSSTSFNGFVILIRLF